MVSVAHQLVKVFAAAWLGTQGVACARGDIILGENGSALAGASGAATAGSVGFAGSADPIEHAVGVAGSAGEQAGPQDAGSAAVDAGAPAPSAASVPVADASLPSTVARPSAGCGKDPVLMDTSIEVNGMRASFQLELPTGYEKTHAYPLVMVFRASDLTVGQPSAKLDLASVTGAAAILVHPNPPSDAAEWEFTRDMPLFDELVARLKAGACIDEDRVFAVGDGGGSRFVNLIGCVRADQVRGVAPLAGAPPPPGPCIGNTALWMLQSTAVEPMEFGATLGNRDYWAGRNSCDVSMPKAVAPAPCVEYAGCDDAHPVRYCEYDGTQLPSFAASGAWSFFLSL